MDVAGAIGLFTEFGQSGEHIEAGPGFSWSAAPCAVDNANMYIRDVVGDMTGKEICSR